MQVLKNISLRRKQTLIIMLTSSVVLFLACAAFVINDTLTFRRELVESVSVLAEAVGNNCAAAIDFHDPKTAKDTLAALHANDNIVSACVYTFDGHVFAVYQRDPTVAFVPPPVHLTSQEFDNSELHLFRPVKQQDDVVGTIFVASDLNDLSARLIRYLGIVIFVFLASLLVALLLSNRLQRLVSDPILHLARVARTVAQDKNYSLRAKKQSNDELGQLVDGFNEMLAQIQQRDSELLSARENLEHRIEERTGELAYERELLRALMDSSPDAIYFKDVQSRFLKSSRIQAINFGMKNADELVGKNDFDFFTEEHARPAYEDEQEIIRTGQSLIGKMEKETLKDGRETWALTSKMPLRNKAGQIIGTFGISKDITVIKETEAALERVHKQLLETSRLAGMAEIATNVLHNIGNVLNSVNVSASVVAHGVKNSKAASLVKIVELLRQHEADLGTFFASDPRGRQLPAYLSQLTQHFLNEQKANIRELNLLQGNIDHIKEIVAMQQNYAKVSGVKEIINLNDLVEDCLRMNDGAMNRHQVEVVREFGTLPQLNVEKHKILQILVNLVRNSKHACQDSTRNGRRLTVRTRHEAGQVKISVMDNGVGIPPENLTRIFNHGFTTRKDGHGFGLHSGALAAKEMGGSLTVHSDGPGQGATFTLELPGPDEGERI